MKRDVALTWKGSGEPCYVDAETTPCSCVEAYGAGAIIRGQYADVIVRESRAHVVELLLEKMREASA